MRKGFITKLLVFAVISLLFLNNESAVMAAEGETKNVLSEIDCNVEESPVETLNDDDLIEGYYDGDGKLHREDEIQEKETDKLLYNEYDISDINPASDLEWLSASKISFSGNNPGKSLYYMVNVFRDGKGITSYCYGALVGNRMLVQGDQQGNYVLDIKNCISESGTYSFKVTICLNDSGEARQNGVITEGPEIQYTKPDKKVGIPTNLKWNSNKSGRAEWSAVSNTDGYHIYLYEDGESKYSQVTSGLSNPVETYKDFLPYIGNINEHEYRFAVRALSADLTKFSNGDISEKSAALDKTNKDNPYEPINDLWKDLEDSEDQDQAQAKIEEYIKGVDLDNEQLRMQTDSDFRNVLNRIENEYKSAANITLDVNTTDETGVDSTSVSIKGGIMNANAGDNVSFNISKPAENDNRALDPKVYSNVLRFDMDLDNASAVTNEGNLRYPVEVTMPVPTYFKDAPFIYVIHYHHSDDGYDIIHPRVNDDYTISFTVTHFSEIAVATSPEGAGYTIAVKQKLNVNDIFKNTYGVTYKKFVVDPKECASASANGVLTGKKKGTVTVTGLKQNGKKFEPDQSIKVNVELPVIKEKKITISSLKTTINGGDNIEGMSILPDEWLSSKDSVVSVNKNTGVITPIKSGTAKITAVYGTDPKLQTKYPFMVTVSLPKMSKEKASLQAGSTLKLTLKNTKETPVWRSSDEETATVDNGVVTILAKGDNADIIAELNGDEFVCHIDVIKPAISKAYLKVKEGNKTKVSLKNSKLKEVDWKSTNEEIATVNKKGEVTALTPGQTEIWTEVAGVTCKCVVEVTSK